MSAVASLKCEFCWSQGKDCKNTSLLGITTPIQECNMDINGFCISGIGNAKMAGSASKFVFKSCVNGEFCHAGYSSAIVTSDMYMLIKTSCCNTDMCNSEPLEMPEPEKRELNGLKCPSCAYFGADQCRSTKTVSCRNDEDHCFYFGGRIGVALSEWSEAEALHLEKCWKLVQFPPLTYNERWIASAKEIR
ncbi:Hypothetical predicted protein [Podarcis lilfordi]|uniref:UPAR/Ly6 domain-containing protein n=1 Tax=Podarcis lilfordi TaxID=74358 RepID=A0AA35KP80_9SAUR|nr:Hypothetical predicted protein [Podarcis lilfordi]